MQFSPNSKYLAIISEKSAFTILVNNLSNGVFPIELEGY